VDEQRQSLNDGPSDEAIGKIQRRFDCVKQVTKRLRIIQGAALVIMILLVSVSFLGWAANERRKQAEVARRDAERQLGIAHWFIGDTAVDNGLAIRACHYYFSAALRLRDTGEPELSRIAAACASRLAKTITATFVHGEPVAGATISADGTKLLAWSEAGLISVWQMQPKKLVSRFTNGTEIAAVAFVGNTNGLVLMTRAGKLIQLDLTLGLKRTNSTDLLSRTIYHACFSRYGNYIAILNGSDVDIWDTANLTKGAISHHNPDPTDSVHFFSEESSDGPLIWTWSRNGIIHVGNAVQTNQLSQLFQVEDARGVAAFDERRIVSWNFNNDIRLWEGHLSTYRSPWASMFAGGFTQEVHKITQQHLRTELDRLTNMARLEQLWNEFELQIGTRFVNGQVTIADRFGSERP